MATTTQQAAATRRCDDTNPRAARSDEELLLAYRETGDHQAFVALVHRYERELFSYLRRYVGDDVMAEDAFQGTFLQVHLKCDQYAEGRPVRPWLYTIATNQAIDAQRRNKRHQAVSLDRPIQSSNADAWALNETLASRETAPADSALADEQRSIVRTAVEGLPESQRGVVALVYFQGMKYREAADVLGIPVGTVKSRLHAAVAKLQSVLQSVPFDLPNERD